MDTTRTLGAGTRALWRAHTGARVRVNGLVKSPQWNEQEGTMLRELANGRVCVKLDVGQELSLNWHSLVIVPGKDSDEEGDSRGTATAASSGRGSSKAWHLRDAEDMAWFLRCARPRPVAARNRSRIRVPYSYWPRDRRSGPAAPASRQGGRCRQIGCIGAQRHARALPL